MSEIRTEKVSKSDGVETSSAVFSGLLAKVKTPKPFDSCLYLRKDVKEQNLLIRVLLGKWEFDKLRVKLEPEEFEKIFDVYASDKEVLMKLFTSDIKQMLIDFKKEMNMDYELTIKNDYLYIRFWCGQMFEVAKLSKFSLDRETIYKYYRMLDLSFELTNKLEKVLNETQYNGDNSK